jgi:hypothetical protein
MSRTVRAIGPTCQSRRGTRGQIPVAGMRPCVAFRATMPVCAAGPRTEMARSLPRPNGAMPAAIAADSPPLDPPGVRSRFHGLFDLPVRRLSVSVEYENSGRFVFASKIAPAFFMRATLVASVSGTRPLKIGEPRCVSTPAVSNESFTVNGTPCRGPTSTPTESASSAAFAASRAPSASVTTALIVGLVASMRSRCARTTSTEDTSRVRISSASFVASE